MKTVRAWCIKRTNDNKLYLWTCSLEEELCGRIFLNSSTLRDMKDANSYGYKVVPVEIREAEDE